MCIHHSIFGIQKLCQKKTVCTFNVTNAVVGSSCGGQSLSALEITYHCVGKLICYKGQGDIVLDMSNIMENIPEVGQFLSYKNKWSLLRQVSEQSYTGVVVVSILPFL